MQSLKRSFITRLNTIVFWMAKKERKKSSGFAFKLDEGLISEINALMHCTSSTVLTNKIGLGIRG